MHKLLVVFVFSISVLSGCRFDEPTEHTVSSIDVSPPRLEAMYFEPLGTEEKVPGIIVLGGSEGGITSVANMARSFSSFGVGTLAVAYFGHKDLPKDLEYIQLEYVAQAIERLKDRPQIDSSRIGIVGASKGAELALLLASHYPEIRFVIALAPSNVVFQGIKRDWSSANGSSWQHQGKPIPFLPYAPPWKVNGQDIADTYQASLNQLDEHRDAVIPVEKINGPILLLSGEDDRMWPATKMSDMIIERLEEFGFEHGYEHLFYPNAGHYVGYPHRDTTYGGTEEGNFAAGEDAQKTISEFLKSL